ncbi:MAG TPA: flagellar protein FlgN, partial [Janthinobacterium sp.]|nr:flagellar protein FlgN [Janthinobacterium sp.]
QSARLTELGDTIMPELKTMEARRRQRVGLVAALLGPEAGMRQVFDLLKGGSRLALESNWSELEHMVLDCKRRNTRNSALLTEQYSIMQRVLHGEDQIYAPG